LRERGEKAPTQRRASPHFSPLCRCAAAMESTHKSHSSPASAVPSLSRFRGNYRATKEESQASGRHKDCCSPFTPPPLHHSRIIKSDTAIPQLESSSI